MMAWAIFFPLVISSLSKIQRTCVVRGNALPTQISISMVACARFSCPWLVWDTQTIITHSYWPRTPTNPTQSPLPLRAVAFPWSASMSTSLSLFFFLPRYPCRDPLNISTDQRTTQLLRACGRLPYMPLKAGTRQCRGNAWQTMAIYNLCSHVSVFFFI